MSNPTEPTKTLLQITQAELGFTDEQNRVTLYDANADFPMSDTAEYPIFSGDSFGNLKILVYGIDQQVIRYLKKGSGQATSAINAKERILHLTRLKEPIVKSDGKIIKYVYEKGQPTYPFFPPGLCEKFSDKTKIKTLVITEGYKKAFKGDMHGLDIIGLGSITHWRDKETGKLHRDIERLIDTCKPDRIIWLTDGDCLDLNHPKTEEELIDLYKRPYSFYQTINSFHDIFSDVKYENIKKYFGHQLTELIEQNTGNHCKGLDDLLVAHPGEEEIICAALLDFGKKGEITNYQNNYFIKFDVTFNPMAVRRYFNIHDVNDSYLYHVSRRKELNGREFIFNGSIYRYDETEGHCIVRIPNDTKLYKRIGTEYFKIIQIPSLHGGFNEELKKWSRDAIKEDIKPKGIKFDDFIFNVEKLNSFCIYPDHFDYQRVIYSCYNVYHPFPHEIEKGENGNEDDFPVTMEFLKHIFGRGIIKWFNPKTMKEEEIKEVELGLDYLKILLCAPTQILPILCLVSKEKSTGKSTFLDWQKFIFGSNMIFVGNEDFKNDFNKHWSSKLVVGCEETKIDKQEVMEKIKRLSTAKKTTMNSKGNDQTEQDFFAKFILNSNNEENFLPTDEDEIRFWVRKIPVILKKNTEIFDELKEEVPAFLHYLKTREFSTQKLERHWFHTDLLKTEALRRLVNNSRPTLEKEIRAHLKDMFEEMNLEEIKMSNQVIRQAFFNNRPELNYVNHILEDRMKLKKSEKSEYFKYPYWKKKEGEDAELVYQATTGRPYCFQRKDFTLLAIYIKTDEQVKEEKDTANVKAGITDDLPF